MREQKALQAFEWTLFVLVVTTLGLARVFVERLAPEGEFGAPAVQEGLLAAQWGLVLLFAALGPGKWYLRIPVAGILLLVAYVGKFYLLPKETFSQLGFRFVSVASVRWWMLVGEFGILMVSLVGLRALGFFIGYDQRPTLPTDVFYPRWSLKSLIVATLLGALAIKGGMMVRASWVADPASHAVIFGMLLALPVSAMVLLGLWTVMRPQNALLRLISVAPIASLVALGVIALAGETYSEVAVPVLLVLGYEAAFVVAALLATRVCGFRLLGPARTQPIAESQVATTAAQTRCDSHSQELQVTG